MDVSHSSPKSPAWRLVGLMLLLAIVGAAMWMRRGEADGAARPQEPSGETPYASQDVDIPHAAAGITLAGTFTLPAGKAPHPAVVLVAGTGLQERDSTQFGHRSFLVLADLLARQGIAVLRLDRRGAGKSTGDFASATHEDFAADTLAAWEFLRRRSGVDPLRVGLIGHSEGGLIALRAAALAPDMAFVVLLASPGLPLAEVVAGQHRVGGAAGGIDPPLLENWIETHQRYLAIVAHGGEPAERERAIRQLWAERVTVLSDAERAKLAITDDALAAMLAQAGQPGFVSAVRADPRALLGAIRCPVLALNGGKDVQVIAADNLPAIRSALAAAGHERPTTILLPQLNHLFQTARTGTVAEYETIAETFDPRAAKLVAQWVNSEPGLSR